MAPEVVSAAKFAINKSGMGIRAHCLLLEHDFGTYSIQVKFIQSMLCLDKILLLAVF